MADDKPTYRYQVSNVLSRVNIGIIWSSLECGGEKLARLEKASWIAGIVGTTITLAAFGWQMHTSKKSEEKKLAPSSAAEASPNSGQIANIVGSGNTTVQGSGNSITIAAQPPSSGVDYVITQADVNRPRNEMYDLEGADRLATQSLTTYCGEGVVTFRNLSQNSVTLMAGVPETDNTETVAGLAPGERYSFSPKDFVEGPLLFFDSEARFKVDLILKKQCSRN